MITEYFLLLFFAPTLFLIHGLFAIIPDFNFLAPYQDSLTGAFSFLLGIANYMNPIIPSSVSITCLTVYVGFYAFYFGMKIISWILRKIPVAGMS